MFRLLALLSVYLVGARMASDQDLVDHLNEAYRTYDPQDDTSSMGVMLTAFEGSGEEPYLADCDHCGSLYGIPTTKTSNCKVSTSILNLKNSYIKKDWAASLMFHVPFGCIAAGTCDIELALYPVGPFNPLKGEIVPLFNQGGVIYGSRARQAVKCAYAADGASMIRPNGGCGCPSYIGTVCPPNDNWQCPTTLDTCSNRDPTSSLRDPHPINENSTVLTACQCTNLGITEEDNHLWRGILDLQYPPGLPKCMWTGPQFFNGKGRDELRQALRQQYNFKEQAFFPWNEIVLDGHTHNTLIANNASEMITAFWYPKHRTCGKACRSAVYEARDNFVHKYGVQVPVVMIDVQNGMVPFVAVGQEEKETLGTEGESQSMIV